MAAVSHDPVRALEHDHAHLSKLVADLRSMLRALDPDASHDIAGTLVALRDDLFEHFAREEEALFPWLASALPDLQPSIAKLEGAHDRICGALSRLVSLVSKGPEAMRVQQALIEHLFERFDAEYVDHARGESELLRGLASRLDERQRAHVRDLMRDV